MICFISGPVDVKYRNLLFRKMFVGGVDQKKSHTEALD